MTMKQLANNVLIQLLSVFSVFSSLHDMSKIHSVKYLETPTSWNVRLHLSHPIVITAYAFFIKATFTDLAARPSGSNGAHCRHGV